MAVSTLGLDGILYLLGVRDREVASRAPRRAPRLLSRPQLSPRRLPSCWEATRARLR